MNAASAGAAIHFAKPEMLRLAAVTLPLLGWFLWRSWIVRRRLIAQFVRPKLLSQLTVGVSRGRQLLRLWFQLGAAACLFLALARPQYGVKWMELPGEQLDLVVAVDVSRSMAARDATPDRLSAAKAAARAAVEGLDAARFALVAFDGAAAVLCPPTPDKAAFVQAVEALDYDLPGAPGTAVGEAAAAALDLLDLSRPAARAILLISDGENHQLGALESARMAARVGAPIFVFGVGSLQGAPVPAPGQNGRETFLRDEQGRQVVSKLDEAFLSEMARLSRGDYVRLEDPRAAGRFAQMWFAPLAAKGSGAILYRRYREQYQWPLGLAILLLFLEMLLPERRRKVPRPERTQVAFSAAVRVSACAAAALFLAAPAAASAGAALQAYEEGRFQKALDLYRRALEKRPEDPRLHYNLGLAAYRLEQFESAANEFSVTLLSEDEELLPRAYYNLGNALCRMGERETDLRRRLDLWKRALNCYESTLEQDPKDEDAAFNRDVLRARIRLLEAKLKRESGKEGTRQAVSGSAQKPQKQGGAGSPKPAPSGPSSRLRPKPAPSPKPPRGFTNALSAEQAAKLIQEAQRSLKLWRPPRPEQTGRANNPSAYPW